MSRQPRTLSRRRVARQLAGAHLRTAAELHTPVEVHRRPADTHAAPGHVEAGRNARARHTRMQRMALRQTGRVV